MVLDRAKELTEQLLEADITTKVKDIAENGKNIARSVSEEKTAYKQMSLFDSLENNEISDEIKELDLANMTPLDALNKLYELQKRIKNQG